MFEFISGTVKKPFFKNLDFKKKLDKLKMLD